MIRRVEFGDKATSKVLKGLNTVADAVKITFGPNGKNVIYENVEGKPSITKDGVTVAHNIELQDSIENLGATLIKDVAKKTVKDVGDGTTTSTILTQALIKEGLKAIQYGENPIKVKREMDEAVGGIEYWLTITTTPLSPDIRDTTMLAVASTSTNNDTQLSNLVVDAIKTTNYDPHSIINITHSSNDLDYVEQIDGVQLNRGYEDPSFMREGHIKLELFEPYVVITAGKIQHKEDLFPYMQEAKKAERPLIIIATDLALPVRDMVKSNHVKGYQDIIYIKMLGLTPVQRENVEDLASLVGQSLQDNPIAFGQLSSAIIERNNATLTPNPEASTIDKRVTLLEELIKIIPDEYEQSRYRERIAKLQGRVATIYLAAASDAEYGERVDRVDDAIHAVQSALTRGVVIGGGIPLAKAAKEILKSDKFNTKGGYIVAEACKEPLRLIYANAPIKPEAIINSPLLNSDSNTVGFDAVTGEPIDFLKEGIVDPVQVPISALTNAASVAGLFLTTGCVIASQEFEV